VNVNLCDRRPQILRGVNRTGTVPHPGAPLLFGHEYLQLRFRTPAPQRHPLAWLALLIDEGLAALRRHLTKD
jgi:hypothetical protein